MLLDKPDPNKKWKLRALLNQIRQKRSTLPLRKKEKEKEKEFKDLIPRSVILMLL